MKNKDKICIVHISDLHRSRENPISNAALLNSLLNDIDSYEASPLCIVNPDVLIISGDIVQGSTDPVNASRIIKAQYDEALNFINELTNKLFNGDKSRVIIIPGNHDISWTESNSSMILLEENKIVSEKGILNKEIFKDYIKINSNIKWSWTDRSFYEVNKIDLYNQRLSYFADFYSKFYESKRLYKLSPEDQFEIFDIPTLGLTIVGYNSCYHNDHLNRAGCIHSECIAKSGLALRKHKQKGRLTLATWHHNTSGGPYDQDYMDNTFLKNLIALNVKISFHGHQHRNEIIRAVNNIVDDKMMIILSAGSLCAGERELPTGFSRQYNIVELTRINEDEINMKLLSRIKTPESSFDNPVWSIGAIDSSGIAEFNKSFYHPAPAIPSLGDAEKLFNDKKFNDAIQILEEHDKEDPFVRKILLECYLKTENFKKIIEDFSAPKSNDEAIQLMNAYLEEGLKKESLKIIQIPIISNSKDASIAHLRDQIKAQAK